MSTLHPDLDQRTRTWLATAFAQSATWRQSKAQEYPDDPRNGKSAAALYSAASYARTKEGGGLHLMRDLVTACDEAGYDVMGDGYVYGFPGERSERLAGRYGFDHEPGLPGDVSHDRLLREIFVAGLEDIRDSLDDEVESDSRLGQLFSAHLTTRVVREPSEIELLTDIRELLRDRLPDRSQIVPSVTTRCAECGKGVVGIPPTLGQARDPNSTRVPQVTLPVTRGDERLAEADENGRFRCPHCGAANVEPGLKLL